MKNHHNWVGFLDVSQYFEESLGIYVLSCVRFFVAPWTIACQVPLSVRFPRKEYGSGLPLPSTEDLPNPGIKPMSHALAGGFFTTEQPEIDSNAFGIREKFPYTSQ